MIRFSGASQANGDWLSWKLNLNARDSLLNDSPAWGKKFLKLTRRCEDRNTRLKELLAEMEPVEQDVVDAHKAASQEYVDGWTLPENPKFSKRKNAELEKNLKKTHDLRKRLNSIRELIEKEIGG